VQPIKKRRGRPPLTELEKKQRKEERDKQKQLGLYEPKKKKVKLQEELKPEQILDQNFFDRYFIKFTHSSC
jgi:hypothetical protein